MPLICVLCQSAVDPSGPGVAMSRSGSAHWVPFIEDLRGSPDHLVHPRCYAEDSGLDALIEVVHQRDEVVRADEYRRWQADQPRRD